jgi:hypothetical protein
MSPQFVFVTISFYNKYSLVVRGCFNVINFWPIAIRQMGREERGNEAACPIEKDSVEGHTRWRDYGSTIGLESYLGFINYQFSVTVS